MVAGCFSGNDGDSSSDNEVTYKDIYEENKAFAREVAGQTIVLLKNDNSALPLDDGESVNVFGIAQVNYQKGGGGSGNVGVSYSVSPLEGMLANESINVNEELATAYVDAYGSLSGNLGEYLEGTSAAEGSSATSTDEIERTTSLLQGVKDFGSTAIVFISRTSGEDSDRAYEKGDYLLSDDETNLLQTVTENFSKVIVLINSPGPIDMSWAATYVPDAILYVGMPGMEGGNAIADILCGDVYPSAKLTETWATNYDDIPSSENMGSSIKGTTPITAENLDEINTFIRTRTGGWYQTGNLIRPVILGKL